MLRKNYEKPELNRYLAVC